MLTTLAYAAVLGAWHIPRGLLIATNRHSGLAWPYLVASAAGLPLAWLMGEMWGLIGLLLLSMLILEACMLAFCFWLCGRLLAPPPAPSALEAAT